MTRCLPARDTSLHQDSAGSAAHRRRHSRPHHHRHGEHSPTARQPHSNGLCTPSQGDPGSRAQVQGHPVAYDPCVNVKPKESKLTPPPVSPPSGIPFSFPSAAQCVVCSFVLLSRAPPLPPTPCAAVLSGCFPLLSPASSPLPVPCVLQPSPTA